MAKPKYLIVDGCPAPYDVAPYIYLVLRRAGQTASSIYRGDDAAALLHRHGKHTQREIHTAPATAAISNPPGHSSHELFTDDGQHRLPRWKVGIDSGGNGRADKLRINNAAKHYGWKTEHPYKRGVEGHHWNFAEQPRAKGLRMRLLIIRTRARLPRR